MILTSIWDSLYSWILLYVSFSVIGLSLFLKFANDKVNESTNELVVNTFNISGVLFSLLITFVVVSVWDNWEEMDTDVASESNALANMYSETFHLPDSQKEPLRKVIRLYTKSLIVDEWPAMKEGIETKVTQDYFIQLRARVHQLYNIPGDNKYFYSQIYPIYIQLSDLRRNRLHQSSDGLPPMVWYLLFTGSFVTILISFFYKAKSLKIQYLMNFLMALMFSIGMYICYDLHNPFRGDSRISSEPFQILLNEQFPFSDIPVKN